jgi:hypothetical protein
MSFQAYLDNIEAKTGLNPIAFVQKAEEKGFLTNGELSTGVKATGGNQLAKRRI